MPENWFIFDADNTLWDVEAIYNVARTEFCALVTRLSDANSTKVEDTQRKIDLRLKATFGYSASRFARSFEETLKVFVNDPSDGVVTKVRMLAEGVFYEKAEIYQGLQEVLRTLRKEGYNLGIVTAGEEWVQRRRLEQFHLRGHFRGIKIVKEKTKEALVAFCKQNDVAVSESHFVGDSVTSDVLPASQAGLKPVLLLKHQHWLEGESKEVPSGIDCIELERVTDLLTHFGLTPDLRLRVPRKAPAYAIFEGGGAKVLAHVGVLKALEDRKFDLETVAGTSAGAIVAGLYAAGYTADELYNEDPGSRGILDFSYLDILGEDEWQRAEKFIEDMQSHAAALTDPQTGSIRALRRWLALGLYLRERKDHITAFNDAKGYFSLDEFRDLYDGWLRKKLIQKGRLNEEHEGPVHFKHLPMNLYVISTDITGKTLRVHSKDADKDEGVANAVAASIAIPAVFQPRELLRSGRGSMHVDGGILSNFPAWLFAVEPLRADPDEEFIPIFGIELQDTQAGSAMEPPGLFGLAKDLVSTAVAGNKKLETRGMRRLLQLPVPVTVKAYAFDIDDEQRTKTYQEGKAAAERFFQANLHAVSPKFMRPYLADVHTKMVNKLESLAHRMSMHLRVNIMARVPPIEAARVSDWPQVQQIEVLYHYNMDLDPDVVIVFGPDEGSVGACYNDRDIQVVDLEWTREAYPAFQMTPVQQALVRSTLKSLMSVPMYNLNVTKITADTQIVGILNFDSDENVLDLFDKFEVKKFAMRLADEITTIWYDFAEHGEVRNVREP